MYTHMSTKGYIHIRDRIQINVMEFYVDVFSFRYLAWKSIGDVLKTITPYLTRI